MPINFATTWPYLVAAVFVIIVVTLALEISSGTRLNSLKKHRMRFRRGHASALMYRSLVRPDVIKLSNGGFLAMYEMHAPDGTVYDPAHLATVEVGIARALSGFSERMVVHMHLDHQPYAEYDRPDSYRTPALQWLDEQREQLFTSGKMFRSKRFVSVSWLPPSVSQERLRAAASIGADAAIRTEDELIEDFEDQLDQIEVNFRAYCDVTRLGVSTESDPYGRPREKSDLLSALCWCVSGRRIRMNVPQPGQPVNGLLAESFRGGFDLKVGDFETRTIFLKEFPEHTLPLVFMRLAELKVGYAFVVRWMPLDGVAARKLLNDASTEWTTKSQESISRTDSYSLEMQASAEAATRFLSHGGKFGITSPCLVIRGKTKKEVDDAVKAAIGLFTEIGYKASRSTLTSEEDYFATLPGDGYHGVRKYPLNAVNAVHMFSFHEESAGRRYIDSPTVPARTPAVAYAVAGMAETLYHVHLNDDPRDVFHHFGVGGTGVGKSTSLEVLAASWVSRMPFAGFTGIDRGRSMYRLTKFLGGEFYDLLGVKNSPGFALFAGIEDDGLYRDVLTELETMVALQGEQVTAERSERMERALTNMKHIEPGLRNLSTYVSVLQDPEQKLRAALRQYTKAGRLGNTFDESVDTFKSSFFNVVEIGSAFSQPPAYLVPILRVLFWKARTQVRQLKESLNRYDLHWLYEIDEAHTLLGNEHGSKFIREMLKMGRKEKFALGMWSNAAADFAQSEILNDIQEQCKTRFYFRNSEVIDDAKTRANYESLGLSRHGIDSLPYIQQRALMIHQPSSREMQEISWRLSDGWIAVMGRSRDVDNRRLDEFMARYPDTWRLELLRYEGVAKPAIMEFAAMMTEAERNGVEPNMSAIADALKAS